MSGQRCRISMARGKGWIGHGVRRGWLIRGRERERRGIEWTGARVVMRATKGNPIAPRGGVEFRIR